MSEPKKNSSLPQVRKPMELLQQLLERKDVVSYVPKIPAQEMYFSLREIGLSDAIELLRFCSPEQIQACFDLDCWRKDHIAGRRMIPWLQALLDLGPVKIGQVFEALDHEYIVSFLKHEIRVYDLSVEDAPEEPQGHFYMTPDRFYVVDVLSEEHGEVIDRLIESLYAKDIDLGRRVMMGAKWDGGAETEETAYQFHAARMSDLGYVEQHEALEIYQVIDPASVRVLEGTGPDFSDPLLRTQSRVFLPQEWVESIRTERLFFSIAMQKLSTAEQNVILRYLLFLLNRALAAEAIDVADPLEAKPVIESTIGFLSMGLEYVARPSVAVADAASSMEVTLASPKEHQQELLRKGILALQTVSLKRLFQVGYNLTLRLSRLGRILIKHGITTLNMKEDVASLLEAPYGDTLRFLLRTPRRPLYNTELDTPKGATSRPFRSLEDVKQTAVAIEEIGALGRFLTLGLGLRPEILAEVVASCHRSLEDFQLSEILGTMIGNFILGHPPAFVPLAGSDLLKLKDVALVPSEGVSKLRPAIQKKVLEMLHIRIKERSLNPEEEKSLWPDVVQQWVERTFLRLSDMLSLLPVVKKSLTRKQLQLVRGVLIKL